MDIRLSDDDRVGTRTLSRKSTRATPKAQRGSRIEPTLGGAVGTFVDDERSSGGWFGRSSKPAPKGKPTKGKATPQRGKAQPVKDKRARKKRSGGGFLFGLFYWAFILTVWGAIAVGAVVVYYAVQLPNSWAVPDRPANIRVVAAGGQLLSNRGATGGEAVSLRELPYYVPEAVIAIEDRRFYQHFGIDPVGLAAVALESVKARRVTRGASTLTQQLAKNLFLTPDQTLGRKVQEAVLALWLERTYSKDQIIELYLNRVDFGHQAVGIEAAAQTYFGKSASNLSLSEAAILAGSLKAPSRLNAKSHPEEAAARARIVLQAMADEGYISQAEAKAAAIDPNQQIRTKVAGSESYVADWVESLMQAYIGDVKEDVVVSTTIDWDKQKEAEFAIKEAVANEGKKRGFSQGALVSMDVDGTVRAMVGGVDYQKSQYNRAVTARRQPGSAFKPFVYLAAMEKGYTPDTVADDAPFTYKGWSPENASHKYAGPVTLRNGLAYSLNTIAARLAIDVTPQTVIDTATRMGISSQMEAVPSIALGTSEVSLLELVGAYAPFANGGIGVIPSVITKIETVSGKVLYQASPGGPGRVIEPRIVAEMNDMLSTALEVGTGKGAHLPGWQIAGKTGTSQKARDALFVGFTSHMVTGVWLGNDDSSGTTLSGGNVPAQVWSQYMTKAHGGLTPVGLPGVGGPMPNAMTDPATGQLIAVDPTTGQPASGQMAGIDPATGQPYQVDPTTGQPVGQGVSIDPATGQPYSMADAGAQTLSVDPATGQSYILDPATGQQIPIDPTTGQPLAQGTGLGGSQQLSAPQTMGAPPATAGQPIQTDAATGRQFVVDPSTNMAYDPVTGELLGQVVQPQAQQTYAQPQETYAQPVQQPAPQPAPAPKKRTTLVDIFGNMFN